MFFYLSKIFWAVAQPLNFAILLLFLALLLMLFRMKRLAATATALAALVLIVPAWTSIGPLMLNPLEERFQRPAQLPDRIDGIVVLGGGFEGAINMVRGGYEIASAGDRFVETAVLALRHPEARIVVSGGTGALIFEGEGDADTAARFFAAFGIAHDRLILENRSRNTAENAAFSKELVDPRPGQNWLLVTSAFHMPRAVGLFRKTDFPVIPWPADYRTSGKEGIGFFRDNPADLLQTTTLAMREWIGLFGYWMSGRIDTLLPGPGQG